VNEKSRAVMLKQARVMGVDLSGVKFHARVANGVAHSHDAANPCVQEKAALLGFDELLALELCADCGGDICTRGSWSDVDTITNALALLEEARGALLASQAPADALALELSCGRLFEQLEALAFHGLPPKLGAALRRAARDLRSPRRQEVPLEAVTSMALVVLASRGLLSWSGRARGDAHQWVLLPLHGEDPGCALEAYVLKRFSVMDGSYLWAPRAAAQLVEEGLHGALELARSTPDAELEALWVLLGDDEHRDLEEALDVARAL
jgi:hypothetical protein